MLLSKYLPGMFQVSRPRWPHLTPDSDLQRFAAMSAFLMMASVDNVKLLLMIHKQEETML